MSFSKQKCAIYNRTFNMINAGIHSRKVPAKLKKNMKRGACTVARKLKANHCPMPPKAKAMAKHCPIR